MFVHKYSPRSYVCAPATNTMLHVCVYQRSTDLQLRRLFPVTCSLGGSSEMEKVRAACSPSDVPALLKGHARVSRQLTRWVGMLQHMRGCFHPACDSWGTCLPVALMLTSLPKPGPSLAEPHHGYCPPWAAWPPHPSASVLWGACPVWMPLSA